LLLLLEIERQTAPTSANCSNINILIGAKNVKVIADTYKMKKSLLNFPLNLFVPVFF